MSSAMSLLIAAYLSIVARSALGDTYTCSADRDACVDSDGTRFNEQELDVGYRNWDNGVREYRSAILFVIPSWLSEKNITGATLKLYYFDAWGSFTNRTILVDRFTQDWTESNLWWFPDSQGSYASATVGGTNFRWISWDVTSQVQDWLHGGASNFGFAIIASTSGSNDNTFRFASREYPNSAYWPKLEISYADFSQPNLGLCRLTGWGDTIVVSFNAGTRTDETVYVGETGYIHWGCKNAGLADAGPHMNKLFIDGAEWRGFSSLGLAAGARDSFVDEPYTFTQVRPYTIRVEMDTSNEVPEASETDNTCERTFAVSSGGQAAATYLDYYQGESENGDLVMTDAKVTLAALSTYYCSLVWTGPAGPIVGYTGLQSHPNGDLFIFSVWDPDLQHPTNLEWRASDTYAVRYGNEGSGWATKASYNWETGSIYRFYVLAYNRNGRTYFSQYVHDVALDVWKHLAVLSYPYPGHWFRAAASFLEDFAPINGQDARHFDLLDGWKRRESDGGWIQWDRARVNYSVALPPNENYNFDADALGDALRMESGGHTKNDTPVGTILSRSMPGSAPMPGNGLSALEIIGPDHVIEGETADYTCMATWSDSSQSDVTPLTTWFASSPGSFVGSELDLGGAEHPATITITAQADILSTSVSAEKTVTVTIPVGTDTPRILATLLLDPVYPNPFNPRTTLRFSMPQPSWVKLVIYDSRGRVIARLLDEHRPAGFGTTTWDGKDTVGGAVASGVYFARLEAGGFARTRGIVLLR